MISYATVQDLAAWSPSTTQPANAVEVLRSASLLIAQAIYEDLYDPATEVTDPKRDATCAQAVAWIRAALDPQAGPAGLPGRPKSKTVENVTIVYDLPTAADRAAALTLLAPDAHAILYTAALLWVPLPSWSDTPDPGVYVDELGRVGGRHHYGPRGAEIDFESYGWP